MSDRKLGLQLILAILHVILLCAKIAPVHSFAHPPLSSRSARAESTIDVRSTIERGMAPKLNEGNAEITKQLERAKAALAVSRAKMEAQEQAEAGLLEEEKKENEKEEESVPFFAMNTDDAGKKEKVIKEKNENGLFTTDGDLMAKLSEEEEWEPRPLLEVFQNEKEKTADAMNIDRDIGQSMYNLRKSLQTEDFRKIFDKRNRFIGDA
mmetsp:Transcript_12497/g.29614  ORF Transcript_12497/g.29614 Transcript_12497/m.29614 type:complete len:209 (+) Transcript_12497:267-893(+)